MFANTVMAAPVFPDLVDVQAAVVVGVQPPRSLVRVPGKHRDGLADLEADAGVQRCRLRGCFHKRKSGSLRRKPWSIVMWLAGSGTCEDTRISRAVRSRLCRLKPCRSRSLARVASAYMKPTRDRLTLVARAASGRRSRTETGLCNQPMCHVCKHNNENSSGGTGQVHKMRPHTVQTNMQWNLCGNTPRYPMWFKRSVATHLVRQHGAKTCGRTPRVVLSTCSTEIQQFSLSSFCWAMLVGCKCGEGCLDKIVTAQKGVLGINVGQIREASLDVPVSCVQEIPPLSADDHLCHCWKASTCSERTSEQVSQHYNQRLGTRSGGIASFKCWRRRPPDDGKVSLETIHAWDGPVWQFNWLELVRAHASERRVASL